ncbi:acrB/AcrD/AcrF family protein, partial [Vibrio parahaemolyticus V-223/04]
LKNR